MSDEVLSVKIAAIMSVPMLGWNPHWQCHSEALRPIGIPLRAAYGCWWDHGISNLMDEYVAEGVDWLLALDYDSMFTSGHVTDIINRAVLNPQIDALSPLQAKRVMPVNGISEEMPILKLLDGRTEQAITNDPFEVEWANFGLTMIRVAALKRTPKPWFLSVPDSSGGYSGGDRIDPDIYFWNNWRKAGNTVYVDPMVSIGHIQPMVAVVNDDMSISHQHWVAWKHDHKAKAVAA